MAKDNFNIIYERNYQRSFMFAKSYVHDEYLQPIITQYFIDNKSEIWLLFLIAHSKRWRFNAFIDY